MVAMHSQRRNRSIVIVSALVALLSQPGCGEQAPATETNQLIEAQKKRAKSLAGELSGLKKPSPRAGKAVRRR